MIDILGWIVLGLVAGVLARWLMPGKDPAGCIVTVLLGIAGAVVGGFVARVLGLAPSTASPGYRHSLLQLSCATAGAVIILVVYRMVAGRRA